MGFEACNASLAIRPFQKSLTNSKHSSKFNRRLTLTVTSLSSAVVLTPNFISNRTLVKRSRRKKLINALHNCKGILKQANWCLKILTTLVEYHYQCAYQRLMHAHQTKFISVHWLVEATLYVLRAACNMFLADKIHPDHTIFEDTFFTHTSLQHLHLSLSHNQNTSE